MQTADDLRTEIDTLRAELIKHIDLIAEQLLRHAGIDVARVNRSVSDIRTLCHKLIQVSPRIGTSKMAAVEEHGTLPPTEAMGWASLERLAGECRGWINQWSKVEDLVRDQIPAKRQKLMNQPSKVALAQMALYDAVFEDLHRVLTPTAQTDDARDHGCFADISLPNSTFVAYAHAAYRVLLAKRLNRPTRFLDVGCGSGFKVMMADRFFDRCDGLEYDPTYAKAADTLFARAQLDTCRVISGDGLVFDGYDDYDVIYFYRPMRHDEQLQQLEQQIIETAKAGTLIIAPYKIFESRFENYGCARIDGWLYMTQSSAEEAATLRKKAEMTGTFVGKLAPRGPSIWDPILGSSVRKGFGF